MEQGGHSATIGYMKSLAPVRFLVVAGACALLPAATPVGLMEVCTHEPPVAYRLLGSVSAESERFATAQENMEYALGQTKEQASRLGANAILLDPEFNKHWGGMIISNVIYEPLDPNPPRRQSVSGQAILLVGGAHGPQVDGCLRGVAQW